MGKHFPNVDWDLSNDSGKIADWQRVEIAVLMDIRRELAKLNALLHCHNFVMVPHTIKSIDRRLAKSVPLRPRRKKQ